MFGKQLSGLNHIAWTSVRVRTSARYPIGGTSTQNNQLHANGVLRDVDGEPLGNAAHNARGEERPYCRRI